MKSGKPMTASGKCINSVMNTVRILINIYHYEISATAYFLPFKIHAVIYRLIPHHACVPNRILTRYIHLICNLINFKINGMK